MKPIALAFAVVASTGIAHASPPSSSLAAGASSIVEDPPAAPVLSSPPRDSERFMVGIVGGVMDHDLYAGALEGGVRLGDSPAWAHLMVGYAAFGGQFARGGVELRTQKGPLHLTAGLDVGEVGAFAFLASPRVGIDIRLGSALHVRPGFELELVGASLATEVVSLGFAIER